MTESDKERIEKLKELCEKATPGPWIYNTYRRIFSYKLIGYEEEGYTIAEIEKLQGDEATLEGKDNAKYIAESRTAIPFLIELAEKQAEELAVARERLGPAGYKIIQELTIARKQIAVMKEALLVGLDFADQVEDQVLAPPAEIDTFRDDAKEALADVDKLEEGK